MGPVGSQYWRQEISAPNGRQRAETGGGPFVEPSYERFAIMPQWHDCKSKRGHTLGMAPKNLKAAVFAGLRQ